VFNRFFKIYVLLEVLVDIIIPIFILLTVYMYLDDNHLFDSPFYIAAAAIICATVFFWIYKIINVVLKADAEDD
jgi:hypothetical protein